ncbi:hypothetical protein SAMN05421785_103430 [Chryseobacterium gambrini]|uniref:DltD C-terminal region n=2 Tax=Chryseobacterium gambrini TaxID=373672 RepID=A0A1N7MRY8_9FLAO|nr:hypothetical protein SAMN05421785_103430 [Chryseobacterium gambrini]
MNLFIFSFSMKKFLFKLSFYLVGCAVVLAVLGSFADGNTDDNYMHFAVEKPENIILGDSRGSQAVQPDILEGKLHKKFDNFAINVVQSPYGKVYLEALKRKIKPNTKNGVFILTVDPWNLSVNKSFDESKDFPEKENSPLGNMYSYDMSPNYEYLLKNYPRSWFKIFSEREESGRSNTFLHKNGWLEVNVSMEKDSVQKRAEAKLKFYKEDLAKTQKISAKRIQALEDMITFLKDKGSVYLVRIPASGEIMNVENRYSPDFSQRIENISKRYHVVYFDFSSKAEDYIYTDANHMYEESGKVFTSQIADSILINSKHLK